MTRALSRAGGWLAFTAGALAGWFFLQTEHRDVRYRTFVCYPCGQSPRIDPRDIYLQHKRGWRAHTTCPGCGRALRGYPDRAAVVALVKLGARVTRL